MEMLIYFRIVGNKLAFPSLPVLFMLLQQKASDIHTSKQQVTQCLLVACYVHHFYYYFSPDLC